ncbi:hypothetical protein EDC96DRAFT_311705 [Choanephora cucurbitarum]|nr:hypothetical protein EDC96DRAFT_313858 [Choanephora cucurbitarum]KAI8348438.1 hypothetical protein EDC96DRAFT_311705 [Choanephora cucurbitarum]
MTVLISRVALLITFASSSCSRSPSQISSMSSSGLKGSMVCFWLFSCTGVPFMTMGASRPVAAVAMFSGFIEGADIVGKYRYKKIVQSKKCGKCEWLKNKKTSEYFDNPFILIKRDNCSI